ncbi:hypothetical protein KUO17_07540 [Pseudomonas sp. MAFF 301350]|uniref:Toxin VasX N-terminal region domain-containing protein n=1 Tax=Pseudomonas aegrilactucae TaxID=2854028 RepID=A0A9Q2XHP1_9PSED|nr:toxin VasX [Pseudomonas aegrilactucae]MBV6286888.1 hypothetical protein [Pseudomonas aegrilactucae]
MNDHPFDQTVLPQLDVSDYPALKGAMHYGLRSLRPGCYVYVFYFRDARMWTQHYQVTEDARFAALWWSELDNDNDTPGQHARMDTAGATAYLPAPEDDVADTVWLLASDTLLSHCTLWKIELDSQALRSQLATAVKPSGGHGQAHVLPSSMLNDQVFELSTHPSLSRIREQAKQWSMFAPSHPLHWSEHQHLPIQGVKVDAAMRAALMARTDIQPLAVVLHDPVGVTSELNNVATRAVQERTRFTAENAHRLTSAQLISGYFEHNHSVENTDTLTRQQALVNWAQLQQFRSTYAARLAAFDAPIERAVEDINAWLNHSSYLALAINTYDLGVPANGKDFEEAVFHCIGALVHTESGRQLLEQMVDMPPDRSLYWQALAQGNANITDRLMKTSSLIKSTFDVVDKYLEEHAATSATNALIGLLQSLPAANKADVLVRRLRHVLELRFNATLVAHELDAAQYLRYAREFEGQQVLGPKLIKRWGLDIDTTVHPTTGDVRMKFYEWIKVDETDYRVLDTAGRQKTALPSKRIVPLEENPFIRRVEQLRGPAGHFFTGLGGVLAIMGVWQSSRAADKSLDANTLLTFLGADAALIGASIEVIATATEIISTRRGNAALASTAKLHGFKYGVSIFGAAGAALLALSDGVRATTAISEHNPEKAHAHFGAALAGSALAFSSWAGGTASTLALTAGKSVVTFLGLTPAGWAVIALITLGAGIYFSLRADKLKHGPVETWLKHSIWGKHDNHYSSQQEMEAFYNLLYRPRLTAQWEQSWNHKVGTLDINCFLPNTMKGERFAWKIRVFLYNKELSEVRAPLIHTHQSQGIDYHYQYLIRRDERVGPLREWKITMHQDAIVKLEYLYHPNFSKQPKIAITQPSSPAPLIFKSADWLDDPIEESFLAPVQAPK